MTSLVHLLSPSSSVFLFLFFLQVSGRKGWREGVFLNQRESCMMPCGVVAMWDFASWPEGIERWELFSIASRSASQRAGVAASCSLTFSSFQRKKKGIMNQEKEEKRRQTTSQAAAAAVCTPSTMIDSNGRYRRLPTFVRSFVQR